ncbi:hypothetical protein FCM35_KLT04847 [Carex littledalei]|uniref:Uncharacterized protein n=1 Tax=Carex littledalei TaxID=544730 RepID=A0A833V9A0_9POAL|nr:hypothetical protein FCM35_KLT04847 [Carex littledalei]
MGSICIMLISTLLVCMILLESRSDASKVKSITTLDASHGKPHINCAPTNKTCRPGDPQAPENTEEEAKNVNVPSSASPPPSSSSDAYGEEEEELPNYGSEMIVLGH